MGPLPVSPAARAEPHPCRWLQGGALRKGANVHAVQNMLSHAKPSITLDVYSDLWDEKAKKLAADLYEAPSRRPDAHPGGLDYSRATSPRPRARFLG